MKRLAFLAVPVAIATACSVPADDVGASTDAVILKNNQNGEREVIYVEGQTVFMIACDGNAAPKRGCAAPAPAHEAMPLEKYLGLLPYKTGVGPRTKTRLTELEADLAAAQKDAADGVQAAAADVAALQTLITNLRSVLNIQDLLGTEGDDITYHQYNFEYAVFRGPFLAQRKLNAEEAARDAATPRQCLGVRFYQTADYGITNSRVWQGEGHLTSRIVIDSEVPVVNEGETYCIPPRAQSLAIFGVSLPPGCKLQPQVTASTQGTSSSQRSVTTINYQGYAEYLFGNVIDGAVSKAPLDVFANNPPWPFCYKFSRIPTATPQGSAQ